MSISYKIEHILCFCPTLIENYKYARYKMGSLCCCCCFLYPDDGVFLTLPVAGEEVSVSNHIEPNRTRDTSLDTLYISIYCIVVRPKTQSKAHVSNENRPTLHLKSYKNARKKKDNQNRTGIACIIHVTKHRQTHTHSGILPGNIPTC